MNYIEPPLPVGDIVICSLIVVVCVYYLSTHWNDVFPK